MSESTINTDQIKKEIDEINDTIWNLRASPKPDYPAEEKIAFAYEKSLQLTYRFGEARCLLNMGMGAFILQHDFTLSEKYISQAIEIFLEIEDLKWEANCLLTKAILQNSSGKPETALYPGLKGMEYYLNHITDPDYTMACYVIGTIYKDLKKHHEAERYYKMGIAFTKDYTGWDARVYAGLSNILSDRGEYDEAIQMGQKGLELLRSEDNQIGISRLLNDLGSIYHRLKKYDQALEYIFEALKIRQENKLKHFVVGSLIDLGNIYFETNQYEKALDFYLQAEPLAIETNHAWRLTIIYRRVADIYKKIDEPRKAVEVFEKLIDLTNSIKHEEKEIKISQSENKLLKEKEAEIERLRNVELKHAYDLIAEKNKEITDSIHYANRIQKTILAPESELQQFLQNYFVFFQPKDIVSGDFYWSIVMDRGNNKQDFYLAVCDSTGHGVPGAFMSLLNTNYLNEAIYEKQIIEPHLILNYVRQRLIESISKEGQKDGFDGILVRINLSEKKLEYAAANNAPILIRNGEIIQLQTNKMPVGHGEKNDSFSLHHIELQTGDALYLYTDGYADQFGGASGKKFKYKPFNQMLSDISHLPVKEQEEKLRTHFENWKGGLEQVDDVCVIGVRL